MHTQVCLFSYRMRPKSWRSWEYLCGMEVHEMDPCHCMGSCSPALLAEGGLDPWAQGLDGVVKRCDVAHPSANSGTWGTCPVGLLLGQRPAGCCSALEVGTDCFLSIPKSAEHSDSI